LAYDTKVVSNYIKRHYLPIFEVYGNTNNSSDLTLCGLLAYPERSWGL